MLVRMIAVIELGLGIAIASAKGLAYLKIHMALGFAISLLLLLLAIVAAVKHRVLAVILGCSFAILLPFIGLKQFPIKFGPALGAVQYAHVAIALGAIGVAEFMNAAIRKHAVKEATPLNPPLDQH